MSVQFGRWSVDGKPVTPRHFEMAASLIAPYGTDNGGRHLKKDIGILHRAFHTTKESRRETQPHISRSGAVITWDGRLDNRADLIHQLKNIVNGGSTDVEVVAAAYEEWETACFARLIGDWALSIWSPGTRSLILAKDFVGTRQLYYAIEDDQVTWCTILDPLVLFPERAFVLEEEYIAGWLSHFPAAHLTPYVGIHSVPPSSFVHVTAARCTIVKYWDLDASKSIHYAGDAEYEEHFRSVFAEAVRRRLRSDTPILAELSGGMDSSSIVCMADRILAAGTAETPRLDTVSYFDDSEPNWNERPYFTRVEEKRGRVGCHIDVAEQALEHKFASECVAATPCSDVSPNRAFSQLAASMQLRGNRVLLSGIGGDEVMGGVPTPMLELQDLLATGRFKMLAHQLKVWALNKRKPWFHLFFEAAQNFLPPGFFVTSGHKRLVPWLCPRFVERHRAALGGYPSRVTLFGPLPSFQQNVSALETLHRQLACHALTSEPPYESRYPYLDRSLLEFMYAIPREQVVRPGQRRSLMRRALAGIVPDELLNRRRKAVVARAPLTAISTNWIRLVEMSRHLVSSDLGIVDSNGFREAVQSAHQGTEINMVAMMRTLEVEAWLLHVTDHNRKRLSTSSDPSPLPRPQAAQVF